MSLRLAVTLFVLSQAVYFFLSKVRDVRISVYSLDVLSGSMEASSPLFLKQPVSRSYTWLGAPCAITEGDYGFLVLFIAGELVTDNAPLSIETRTSKTEN